MDFQFGPIFAKNLKFTTNLYLIASKFDFEFVKRQAQLSNPNGEVYLVILKLCHNVFLLIFPISSLKFQKEYSFYFLLIFHQKLVMNKFLIHTLRVHFLLANWFCAFVVKIILGFSFSFFAFYFISCLICQIGRFLVLAPFFRSCIFR